MKLTLEQIINAVESDRSIGLCRVCGNEQGGCEPDARYRKCENCGELEVFGAEELLIAFALNR